MTPEQVEAEYGALQVVGSVFFGGMLFRAPCAAIAASVTTLASLKLTARSPLDSSLACAAIAGAAAAGYALDCKIQTPRPKNKV